MWHNPWLSGDPVFTISGGTSFSKKLKGNEDVVKEFRGRNTKTEEKDNGHYQHKFGKCPALNHHNHQFLPELRTRAYIHKMMKEMPGSSMAALLGGKRNWTGVCWLFLKFRPR